MDTKSKKWKTIISFASFILGVSLLLQSGCSLVYRIIAGNGISDLTEDYQNTADFKVYMQSRLADFLSVAAGGSNGWWYESYYDYESGIADVYIDYEETSTIAEDTAWNLPYNEAVASDIPDEEAGESEEEQKKRKEQRIKDYMQTIAMDKNLLYRISYDGEELYSNMEDIMWKEPGDVMPEGYNFLLYFDGEKVTILKDNRELDIYGDGYYREGEDWYVPGYKNFTVDENMAKAKVVMFASKVPFLYSMAKYGENNYVSAGNRLYYIAMHTKETLHDVQAEIIRFICGLFLFMIYLVLHKEKHAADVFIGRVTGKIWFEGKLIFVAAAVILICLDAVKYYQYYGGGVISELYYEYAYVAEYGGSVYFLKEIAAEILYYIAMQPVLMISVFCLLYLCINDIRQNRGNFLRGLVSQCMERFETKNFVLSYSKRQIRRYFVVFIVGMSVFVLLGIEICFIYFNSNMNINAEKKNFFGIVFLVVFYGILFLGASYWYLTKTSLQAKELELLAKQIHAIHKGDYSKENELPEGSELRELSARLTEIQQGMESAIDERMKSEHMKVELVANVSHDIKTPLTSIISYVQFLKQEEDLPEHVKDYIRILDEKSTRLNHMVQDVFEVSKAASGQLPVKMENLDFGKLLRQTLADMEEQITLAPVTLKADIPEHEIMIYADGNRMYRVFQNLIVNAFKYSLEGSRVFLTLTEDGTFAKASIKNTSRQELSAGKDFTGRFIRGDESRTDGGSGLGLSIAKSFTEACRGSFRLETDADLFVVEIMFRKIGLR